MTKYAIILQTTENSVTFRSTRGFYNKNLHDLKQTGYEIKTIDVNNIKSQLASLPPSSVGFLWIRMHGSPQSMTATKEIEITVENCGDIFESLPYILNENAWVFLESCSTGYLLPDFNNMQFAFAKLTIEKPMVKIVAPSKNSHINYFSIQEDGSFYFEIQEKHFMNERNIAVVLGQETKALMRNAIEHNIMLESRADDIFKSLKINQECPFLESFKTEYSGGLCGAGFDLTNVLMNVIEQHFDEYDIVLDCVKKLVEVFHASTNFETEHIFAYSIHITAPLAAAIYFKHTELVKFLLNNGANPSYSFNSQTILDFSKQVDENTHRMPSWKKECIDSQRREMNDNSKMADIVMEHLESSEKQQESAYINQCFWNSTGLMNGEANTSERQNLNLLF